MAVYCMDEDFFSSKGGTYEVLWSKERRLYSLSSLPMVSRKIESSSKSSTTDVSILFYSIFLLAEEVPD